MNKTMLRTVLTVLLGAVVVVLAGCGQDQSGANGGSKVGTLAARPNSPELMDHSYGYLKTGDKDFIRMAPNYSTLRPFAPDTAIVVEPHSQAEGIASPPADYVEYLHIRINRPMSIRIVIADSTGTGKLVYEWTDLPVGAYTAGSKGWPVPQIELTKDMSWVYVYVVADSRFRYRTRFRLNEDGHFIPIAPKPQAG